VILPIVKYGQAVLRQRGAPIERITPEIRKLIEDMLETMQAAAGIGLAAQQVGHALQLTVVDVRAVTDRPSTLEIKGRPAEVSGFMPLVLVNPRLKPYGPTVTGPEGCLSFPEVYGDVPRPESVEVSALDAKGEPYEFKAGGLLSRAVQHEVDHLNGILFIDRMSFETKRGLQADLDKIQHQTKLALSRARGAGRF
jgi:peptide deformylase